MTNNTSKASLKPYQKPLPIDPLLHAYSGATASAISTLLLYPIEYIKLQKTLMNKRIQYEEQNEEERKCNGQQINNQNNLQNQKSQSLINMADHIYKKQGLCGFYKGFSALLTGNVISYAIYFYWYELSKKILKIKPGDIQGSTLASLISGSATSIGTNPFWVINTRMAIQKSQDNLNFFQTMIQMVKKEGFLSLYKGQLASLLLVINPIIQFTVYEYLKSKITTKKYQFLLYFIAGAISKIIATIVTYPPQLLRTHSHINKSKKRENYIKLIKKLVDEEGIYGLYKGVEAKMLQSVLNSAFMLAFYETVFKIVKIFYLSFIQRPEIQNSANK